MILMLTYSPKYLFSLPIYSVSKYQGCDKQGEETNMMDIKSNRNKPQAITH